MTDHHQARTALRDVLAAIYPEEENARRVCRDALLDIRVIAFSDVALNTWTNVLEEAEKHGAMDRLVKVVAKEYGNYPPLAEAYDAYLHAVPTPSPSPDPNKEPRQKYWVVAGAIAGLAVLAIALLAPRILPALFLKPTPTPQLIETGTIPDSPVITIGANPQVLEPQECTVVSWTVDGAQAVYFGQENLEIRDVRYEDKQVQSQDSREECPEGKTQYYVRALDDQKRESVRAVRVTFQSADTTPITVEPIATSKPVIQGRNPRSQIAFLDPEGYIHIVDPADMSSTPRVMATSPMDGWKQVTTFRRMNQPDLIAATSADAAWMLMPAMSWASSILDDQTHAGAPAEPYVMPARSGLETSDPRLAFQLLATSIAARDADGDGADDQVILQRIIGPDGYLVSLVEYPEGSMPTQNITELGRYIYASPWLRIRAGNIDEQPGDELVMIRNSQEAELMALKTLRGQEPTVILRAIFGFPWINLMLGNLDSANGQASELLLSRGGVLAYFSSLLVFQFDTRSGALVDIGANHNYPYWYDTASGDIDGDGEEEAFSVRMGSRPFTTLYGFGLAPSDQQWDYSVEDPLSVAMGDFDADGRDEIVTVSEGLMSVFWEPERTDYRTVLAGRFAGPLAVGRFMP